VPRTGELRTKGTLQRPPDSPSHDASGQPVEEWVDVSVVWGSLNPLVGREAWQARQVQSEVTHSLWVRYSSEVENLRSTWRFVTSDESRVFEFESAVRREENRIAWWEIQCKEAPDQTAPANPPDYWPGPMW
jgi:SPP1 family predicted phage head-tail adaptor